MPYFRRFRPSFSARRSGARRPWARKGLWAQRSMRRTEVNLRRSQGRDDASLAVLWPKQGFPSRLTVTLPYEYAARVNPGVLTTVDTILAINNAIDLNSSAGGNQQARGFDQWTPQYENYRINYVTVKICVRQRAAHGIRVVTHLNSSGTDLGAETRPSELERAENHGTTSSNQPPVEFTRTYYPASAFGMTKDQYQGDERTQAAVAAAPGAIAYLHILVAQLDALTVADFEIEVYMKVNITFFDRASIAAS